MSYFIIIRGPLGSGKTTISKKLSEILDAKYIGMDQVLEEHGLDKRPPEAECIPAENFIKASDLVIPEAKSALESGRVVVFDACFYHQSVIEDLIQRLPFDHYVFTLKAPLELCIERDSKRERVYGEGAAWAVHSLVSRFEYGTNVDVSGSLEDTLKEIISYLP